MCQQPWSVRRSQWAAVLTVAVLAVSGHAAATTAMAQGGGRPILVPLPTPVNTYIPELGAYIKPYRFQNDHFMPNATIRAGALALQVVGTNNNGGVLLKRNGNQFRFRVKDDYILQVDGQRVKSVDDLIEKLQQGGNSVDLGIYDHAQGTFGQYRTQP
jgi:S1-C subfamily serine protease